METPVDQRSTVSSGTSSSLLFFRRSSSHSGSSRKKAAVVSPVASQPLLSPSSSSSSSTPTKTMKNGSVCSSNKRGGSTRVARLASLFSSRAVVAAKSNSAPNSVAKTSEMSSNSERGTRRQRLQSRQQQLKSNSQPPSPTRSSDASSAYVGWPGTQDKRGTTVKMESSYDDSSVGNNPHNFRVNYERELEQAAQTEVKKWMSTSPPRKTKLTPLERRIVHGPQEEESSSDEESEGNPADFALAAVVADAAAAASSPLASEGKKQFHSSKERSTQSEAPPVNSYLQTQKFLQQSRLRQSARSAAGRSAVSNASGISIQDLFLGKQQEKETNNPNVDPWDIDSGASGSTSVSSLYFGTNGKLGVDPSGARGVVRPRTTMRITEEALKEKDRLTPPHRVLNAKYARGYRGFLDKTREVPNLLDNMDSDTSSRATSTNVSSAIDARNRSKVSETSDVFDGIVPSETGAPHAIQEEDDDELNVVVLPSGLASIQTPQTDFDERKTSAEYDETLTNSEVDQYGFIKLPKFAEKSGATFAPPVTSDSSASARRLRDTIGPQESEEDSSSSGSFLYPGPYQRSPSSPMTASEDDLSMYYVPPNLVKKLVRKYRKMSNGAGPDDEEEDAKKAFALLEMRSRIMEKDMDRGLERRGGTVVVDDLVLTSYYQAAQRVRDAVIVSKAWRDGASPKDVVTAWLLTRRQERAYYIRRGEYDYEQVQWMDDTDFMQLRCPSLGPRCMRGFEMFTIGDCQSILLKLTNERCLQLRSELNVATARQIEAEEIMKHEGETSDHGMMTEAEMTYLTAMEEVKALSKQLVVAERSFHLVRDRIEQLVSKYETLLVRIEADSSVAPSSVITFDSSYYTEDEYDDQEKQILARRAQRAEIKAELAAREAMLAKKEAEKNLEEKQRELEELQQRLVELQSEPSHAYPDRDHSVILAKAIAANSAETSPYQERIDGVKQKFRDRMAERKRSPPTKSLLSGEEMFQYLDFYERSLKSVENSQRVGSIEDTAT